MLLQYRYIDSKFPAVQCAKVASKYQVKYKIYTYTKIFQNYTPSMTLESDTVNPFQNTDSLITLKVQ